MIRLNLPALIITKIKLLFLSRLAKRAKKALNDAIHNTKTATDELNRLYEQFLDKVKKQEKVAVSLKRHSTPLDGRLYLHREIQSGKVTVSEKANTALTRLDVERSLVRHRLCDWGSVSAKQWQHNNYSAIHNDGEIRSRYHCYADCYFWVITDLKRRISAVKLEAEI